MKRVRLSSSDAEISEALRERWLSIARWWNAGTAILLLVCVPTGGVLVVYGWLGLDAGLLVNGHAANPTETLIVGCALLGASALFLLVRFFIRRYLQS